MAPGALSHRWAEVGSCYACCVNDLAEGEGITPTAGQGHQEVAEELRRCMSHHDRAGAVTAILAEVERGRPIEELYVGVLEPFLHWVGWQWQQGSAAVWEEHLMVSAVRTAVDALYPLILRAKQAVTPVPATVAFFCPPEEAHDLGLRMLVDRFDLHGFRTVYVGAMTPVGQMIECAQTVQADLVCLSASSHFQRTALLEVLRRLEDALPGTRIVVGGPAFAYSGAGWEKYTIASVDHLMEELAAAAGGGETRA